jgi:hypothetical protein
VSALAEKGQGHARERSDGRERDRDGRDSRRGSDANAGTPSAPGGKIPTGPAAHRDKRRKDSDNAIASLFTAGLRKQAKGSRRGGVKTEGEAERDLERAERERERERRW